MSKFVRYKSYLFIYCPSIVFTYLGRSGDATFYLAQLQTFTCKHPREYFAYLNRVSNHTMNISLPANHELIKIKYIFYKIKLE